MLDERDENLYQSGFEELLQSVLGLSKGFVLDAAGFVDQVGLELATGLGLVHMPVEGFLLLRRALRWRIFQSTAGHRNISVITRVV